MGLFGLFATMIGLGAMTKDYISDSKATSESIDKAKRNGSSVYTSYMGHGITTVSLKTGNRVSYTTDKYTGHYIYQDEKTGETVEDITVSLNKEKTEQKRREAISKGKAFYCTKQFDGALGKSGTREPIYLCTKMDGYFVKRERRHDLFFDKHLSRDRELVVYVKGELQDSDWYYTIGGDIERKVYKKEVVIPQRMEKWEMYFEDGIPYSKEEHIKRIEKENKEWARKREHHFYSPVFREFEGFGLKLLDLETDEYYVNYNYWKDSEGRIYWSEYDSYMKAKIVKGSEIGYTNYYIDKDFLVPIDPNERFNIYGEKLPKKGEM